MNLNSWAPSSSCWLCCTVSRSDIKLKCPSGLWPKCELSLSSDCLLSLHCLLTSGQKELHYTHTQNCRQRTGKTLNACSRSPLADNTVVGENCIFVCVRACVCVCAQMAMDYANTWLCMSCLAMLVSQIPRQHLLHSAKVLEPAFVALLRKEIAFQMLFALVFFPPLDRAA